MSADSVLLQHNATAAHAVQGLVLMLPGTGVWSGRDWRCDAARRRLCREDRPPERSEPLGQATEGRGWWRRRELNPGPKTVSTTALHV